MAKKLSMRKAKPGERSLRPHIRWMVRRDMREVLAIEAACFEFPWREDDFISALRQRNCIGQVVEHDDRVVGFVVYELYKQHIHVLNLAVSPADRRAGFGGAILRKLCDKLLVARRNRIVLEVQESNLPAQLFFRACGFRATGTVRGHYADTPEDAYVMEYRLASRTAGEEAANAACKGAK